MAEAAIQIRPNQLGEHEFILSGRIVSTREQSSKKSGELFHISTFETYGGAIDILLDHPLPLGDCKAIFRGVVAMRAELYERDGRTQIGRPRGQITGQFLRLASA